MKGIEGQSRTSDDLPDQPLRVRHEQKMATYGPIADQNNLQLVPAASQTGQIYGSFKSLLREQIADSSKINMVRLRTDIIFSLFLPSSLKLDKFMPL